MGEEEADLEEESGYSPLAGQFHHGQFDVVGDQF